MVRVVLHVLREVLCARRADRYEEANEAQMRQRKIKPQSARREAMAEAGRDKAESEEGSSKK